VPCTSFARRGGDHLGAALSAATPPTSSPTAPRGRILTPPTSMTTSSGMTTARVMTEEASVRGQEEEVPEDHVSSVCCLERLQLL
jgi:hypothetical protein